MRLSTTDAWQRAAPIRSMLMAPASEKACEAGWGDRGLPSLADLGNGIQVCVEESAVCRELQATIDDVTEQLRSVHDPCSTDRRYPIGIVIGDVVPAVDYEFEAYKLEVEEGQCRITAGSVAGARRGLYALLDDAICSGVAAIPLGTRVGGVSLQRRITRSPIAAYRFCSGWELLDQNDYYPESYLKQIARMGVNGVWVAGLFRTIVNSRVFPELGPPTHRLHKLKTLVEKARRYGIKVYLFNMEPRSVRSHQAIYHARPEVLGAQVDDTERCFCTSHPEVREYLSQAIETIFTQVPDLGGLISIFNGERITNCWLSEAYAQRCPRCSSRTQAEVLAEYLGCQAEGLRRAGTDAKCLAWSYWMDPSDELQTHAVKPLLDVIEKSDPDIVWLANFEHGGKKMMAGKEISIDEYSLSYAGPSGHFEHVAEVCRRGQRQVHAKLQIGSPFELSSLPYVPVPGIAFDKVRGMQSQGVTGAMLNWIPGGVASLMMDAIDRSASFPGTKEALLERLAGRYWSKRAVVDVVRAWQAFEESFREYPFNNRFFYYGPIVRAPAYPLRLNPEPNDAFPLNWGINRFREPQPFEETLERWLGPFTPDDLVNQLRIMTAGWERGLEHLQRAVQHDGSATAREQWAVADAVRCHFQSTLNVIQFIQSRRAILAGNDASAISQIGAMKAIVRSQVNVAKAMKTHIVTVPSIGYQSEILDYSYDGPLLDEAIAACEQTLERLERPIDAIRHDVQQPRPVLVSNTGIPDIDEFGD